MQRLGTIALTALISAACIAAYLCMPAYTFTAVPSAPGTLLYHFSHANAFHLAANLVALWLYRPRLHTCLVAYAAASLASLIPVAAIGEPTCGLSAFIFAAWARKFCLWRRPFISIIAGNMALAFVPHCNWRVHILAFTLSYIYWYVFRTVKEYKHEAAGRAS